MASRAKAGQTSRPSCSSLVATLRTRFGDADSSDLDWMPAARYAPFWRRMPAFALPSYYDGRIRINVAGRESNGIISAAQYRAVCNETIEMLNQCTNLLTGEKVISGIHCPKPNPMDVGPSEADLYVVWQSAPLGLRHPRLGSIGPVPYRPREVTRANTVSFWLKALVWCQATVRPQVRSMSSQLSSNCSVRNQVPTSAVSRSQAALPSHRKKFRPDSTRTKPEAKRTFILQVFSVNGVAWSGDVWPANLLVGPSIKYM